jgi:HK97 family phage portal protein
VLERLKSALTNLATKALNVPLSSPSALDLFGVPPAASGVHVDALTALRVPAVQQGVKLISESIATLDACLHREGEGGRETVAAPDHPVARVLERPNPWTGETEFKAALIRDMLLWGNGLALVSRVRGEVRELHRIDPRSCSIIVDQLTGEPRYSVALQEGGVREFSFHDVIHLRNVTIDGARGLGLVNLGAEAIGLANVLEQHAAALFARGARPGGALEIAGKLTTETMTRLRDSFSNIYAGTHNSGRTAILEQGVKFTPLQLASTDSQFLENRKFQVLEVARLLNMPAVLLNDLEHATLSNAEHLAQQFLGHTIAPILELFEDALERTLLTDEELDAGFAIEFDTTNFVRADLDKRFAALKTGIESGVLTLNEARDREGLPPVEGGDAPMRSVQTIPLAPDAAATPATPAPAQKPAKDASQ